MSCVDLSDRALVLLKALIEKYIEGGLPVGSKTLASEVGLSLSSASIRNILADLEKQGLIASPHTSAGRIPTHKGYRLFVNSLITMSPIERRDVHELQGRLDLGLNQNELATQASELLAQMTQLTSLIMLPKRTRHLLRHIEFLPLSDQRVLVILVVNNQEVHNRIVATHRDFSREELHRIANYLNQEYIGQDLEAICQSLALAIEQERDQLHQWIKGAMELLPPGILPDQAQLKISGESYLLAAHSDADLDLSSLKNLFEAFAQKSHVFNLLQGCLAERNLQIFIGEESGVKCFDDFSIVSAPYRNDSQEVIGVLAVVGPTRMPYQKIIPKVSLTAKFLSDALNNPK